MTGWAWPPVTVAVSAKSAPHGVNFAHAAGSVVGWLCVGVVVVLVVRKWRRQYKDAVALRQHLETTVSQLQEAQAEARAASVATGGSVVVNAPGVQLGADHDAAGSALGDHAAGLSGAVPAGLDRGVAALPLMADHSTGRPVFRPDAFAHVPPPPPPPPPGRYRPVDGAA